MGVALAVIVGGLDGECLVKVVSVIYYCDALSLRALRGFLAVRVELLGNVGLS